MPYLLKMRYAFVIRLFFVRLAAVTFPRATFYFSSSLAMMSGIDIQCQPPRCVVVIVMFSLPRPGECAGVCKSNINWHLKTFNGHMERTAKCFFPSFHFFFLFFFETILMFSQLSHFNDILKSN